MAEFSMLVSLSNLGIYPAGSDPVPEPVMPPAPARLVHLAKPEESEVSTFPLPGLPPVILTWLLIIKGLLKVDVPPTPTLPVKLPVPETSRLYAGEVVPIPTFPKTASPSAGPVTAPVPQPKTVLPLTAKLDEVEDTP